MTAFCCSFVLWPGLRVRSFDITHESDLSYSNGYKGFLLGSFPCICELKTVCDVGVPPRVQGASLGDTSAKSSVLSEAICRAPGCVEIAVYTGVKRTSLSVPSRAHPNRLVSWPPLKPDRALKITTCHARVSQSAFYLIKEVPTCPCSAGGRMCVCIDENRGFLSLVVFFFFCLNALQFTWDCAPPIQAEGTYFLPLELDRSELPVPYHDLGASGWLWSLEAQVADKDMSLFLAGIQHQSHPGQRLVWWHMQSSTSVFWSTSWTAFLPFSFPASGRRVLNYVSRLPSCITHTHTHTHPPPPRGHVRILMQLTKS